jgi:hypothetical protein
MARAGWCPLAPPPSGLFFSASQRGFHMAGTATIDEPQALISTPDTQLLYMSRRSMLRLTLRPRYWKRDPTTGEKTEMTPGIFAAFRDGVLRIPPSGPCVLTDSLNGGEVEIEDAADVVKLLDRHRLINNREEGFWRVDPTAPPVSQSEMRAMLKAARTLDVETLERIIETEKAGWGRAAIIDEAQEAVDEIRKALAEYEAQAKAEADAAKSKPKKAETE